LTVVEADNDKAEDAEEEEETVEARLNTPARNTATIPKKVPDNVPYTRQALFNLLKFMEYSTDHKVYKTAW
jgi:hypothetical protein